MSDPIKSADSIGFFAEFLMENRDLGLESDFADWHDGFGVGLGGFYRFGEAPFHLGLLFKYSKLETEIKFEDFSPETSELEIMSIGVTGEYPVELGEGFILPLGFSFSLVHYGSENLYFDLHQNPWDEIDAWGGQIAGYAGLGYRLEEVPLVFSVLGSITGDFGLDFVQSVVGNPEVNEYRSDQSPLGFNLSLRVSYEPIQISSGGLVDPNDEVFDQLKEYRTQLSDLAQEAEELSVTMSLVLLELRKFAEQDTLTDDQRELYSSYDQQYENTKALYQDLFDHSVEAFGAMKREYEGLDSEYQDHGMVLLNEGSEFGRTVGRLKKEFKAAADDSLRVINMKAYGITQEFSGLGLMLETGEALVDVPAPFYTPHLIIEIDGGVAFDTDAGKIEILNSDDSDDREVEIVGSGKPEDPVRIKYVGE